MNKLLDHSFIGPENKDGGLLLCSLNDGYSKNAVGKTSTLQQIKEENPEITFCFENPQPIVAKREALSLDLSTLNGFLENQRLFIETELRRWSDIPDGLTVFDRGPEDTECYTVNYPKVQGMRWDIESELKTEFALLRACRLNRVIYLIASDDILQKRRANDTDFLDISAFSIAEATSAVSDWIFVNKRLT